MLFAPVLLMIMTPDVTAITPAASITAKTTLPKSSSPSSGFLHEAQRLGVNAVPKSRGRRAVFEHMPQVRSASPAVDLGPQHSMSGVTLRLYRFRTCGTPEAGPARARTILRLRPEESGAAAHTQIRTAPFEVMVLTRKGSLCALPAGYPVLLRGQLPPPTVVALDNLLYHWPFPPWPMLTSHPHTGSVRESVPTHSDFGLLRGREHKRSHASPRTRYLRGALWPCRLHRHTRGCNNGRAGLSQMSWAGVTQTLGRPAC